MNTPYFSNECCEMFSLGGDEIIVQDLPTGLEPACSVGLVAGSQPAVLGWLVGASLQCWVGGSQPAVLGWWF